MVFRSGALGFVGQWISIIEKDDTVWDQNAYNELFRRCGTRVGVVLGCCTTATATAIIIRVLPACPANVDVLWPCQAACTFARAK